MSNETESTDSLGRIFEAALRVRLTRRELGKTAAGGALGAVVYSLLRGREAKAGSEDIPDFDSVRQYLAGGEFENPDKFAGRLSFDPNSGSKLVTTARLYEDSGGDISGFYPALAAQASLSPNTTAVLSDNGIFIFKNDPKYWRQETPIGVTFINPQTQQPVEVELPHNRFSFRWHDEMGLVATLWGHTVTHQYNTDTGEWIALKEHAKLGTARQRVEKNLRDLQEFFGLSQTEIDAFATTGRLDGYQSFVILPDEDMEPDTILITGGKAGLKYIIDDKGHSNIQNVIAANKRMVELGIKNYFKKYGVRFFSNFYTQDPDAQSFTTTYDVKKGGIELNEKRGSFNWQVGEIMGLSLLEARHIIDEQNFKAEGGLSVLRADYALSPNMGVDVGLFLKQLGKQLGSKLSPEEALGFEIMGNNSIITYRNWPGYPKVDS